MWWWKYKDKEITNVLNGRCVHIYYYIEMPTASMDSHYMDELKKSVKERRTIPAKFLLNETNEALIKEKEDA